MIVLPWPPSVNHYWARNRDGSMRIGDKGKAFRQAVQWMAAKDKWMRHEGPVSVVIEAWRPDKRRRDLDNVLKATLDTLVYAGVLVDDSQVHDLRIYWAPDIGGMLKVDIEARP